MVEVKSKIQKFSLFAWLKVTGQFVAVPLDSSFRSKY